MDMWLLRRLKAPRLVREADADPNRVDAVLKRAAPRPKISTAAGNLAERPSHSDRRHPVDEAVHSAIRRARRELSYA
jgi:hypothetical protein